MLPLAAAQDTKEKNKIATPPTQTHPLIVKFSGAMASPGAKPQATPGQGELARLGLNRPGRFTPYSLCCGYSPSADPSSNTFTKLVLSTSSRKQTAASPGP